MDGHKKRTSLTASGMAAVLSCVLLFSCNNEDFLENDGYTQGKSCDNICFGISSDGNVRTRGNAASGEDGYTSGRFVLRSQDSADTLCVRAIVSDGVHSSAFGDRQAVTRGTPVTEDNFYNSFHVLAYWKRTARRSRSNFIWTQMSPKPETVYGAAPTRTIGRERDMFSSSMRGRLLPTLSARHRNLPQPRRSHIPSRQKRPIRKILWWQGRTKHPATITQRRSLPSTTSVPLCVS